MALIGEKYGETVRTVSIFEGENAKYSYELCGGTHIDRTSDIGAFLIVSEGSAAAGIRRIEAVTGRGAYELVNKRFKTLKQAAGSLKSSVEEVPARVDALQNEVSELKKELANLRSQQALATFDLRLSTIFPCPTSAHPPSSSSPRSLSFIGFTASITLILSSRPRRLPLLELRSFPFASLRAMKKIIFATA